MWHWAIDRLPFGWTRMDSPRSPRVSKASSSVVSSPSRVTSIWGFLEEPLHRQALMDPRGPELEAPVEVPEGQPPVNQSLPGAGQLGYQGAQVLGHGPEVDLHRSRLHLHHLGGQQLQRLPVGGVEEMLYPPGDLLAAPGAVWHQTLRPVAAEYVRRAEPQESRYLVGPPAGYDRQPGPKVHEGFQRLPDPWPGMGPVSFGGQGGQGPVVVQEQG